MQKLLQKHIYLDNNATTRTCDKATRVMTAWIQSCSNPSGNSVLSMASKSLLEKSQATINNLCGLQNKYYTLFTSGATESNCMLLLMVVDAWHRRHKTLPHIITSCIEHKSILTCLHQMHKDGRAEYSMAKVDNTGTVLLSDIESHIKKNTALITVMYANNELGSINNMRQLGLLAHKRGVPLHTDAVQMFGKLAIEMPKLHIDALSMSFHKLYGPVGVGMLILRKTFVQDAGLQAHIAGTQQHGLRGGTENICGIAGGMAALCEVFRERDAKNLKLQAMRDIIVRGVAPLAVSYAELVRNPRGSGRRICVLGGDNCLPNTILLSVIDYDELFCNVLFKQQLESHGVIVSIGSACNTSSKHASHVLDAIHAPAIVKRGTLRVSLGDNNTLADARGFVKVFMRLVRI